MIRYFYPAIIRKLDDGKYAGQLPDFNESEPFTAVGKSLGDLSDQLFKKIGDFLLGKDAKKYPPSDPVEVSLMISSPYTVILIDFDELKYQQQYCSKAVTKTVSLPYWLNEMANREHIKCAQVLQRALIQQLHLDEPQEASFDLSSAEGEDAIIDVTNAPSSGRVYGGNDTQKLGLRTHGANWIFKFPSKDHRAAAEVFGAEVYDILGFPVQETYLARYGKTTGVICKDFCRKGDILQSFESYMTTFLPKNLTDWRARLAHGRMELETTLLLFREHPAFRRWPEVRERFWDLFLIDALIGNTQRMPSDWGILQHADGALKLAPIYDNGAALSPLPTEAEMEEMLSDAEKLNSYAIDDAVCAFLDADGKPIHPFTYLAGDSDPRLRKEFYWLYPKIVDKMDDMTGLLDDIPAFTNLERQFYREVLRWRVSFLGETYAEFFGGEDSDVEA